LQRYNIFLEIFEIIKIICNFATYFKIQKRTNAILVEEKPEKFLINNNYKENKRAKVHAEAWLVRTYSLV